MPGFAMFRLSSVSWDLPCFGIRARLAKPQTWTVTGPQACRRTPRVEGFLLAQAAGAEAPSHEIDRTTTSIWRYNLEAWMPSGFGFDVFVWRRCLQNLAQGFARPADPCQP